MSGKSNFSLRPTDLADTNGSNLLKARAFALDSHLTAALGDAWTSAKLSLRVSLECLSGTKELWSFFLIAVDAIKKIDAPNELTESLVDLEGFRTLAIKSPEEQLLLSVVADHPTIRSDLANSWHPSWNGAGVVPADQVEATEIDRIASALALIERVSPRATTLIAEVCDAICLLRRSDEKVIDGNCISLTSKLIPGLVYFTAAPIIMTSESLIHESAHLWLSRFEGAKDMYVDPTRTVLSPLRPDPRPLSGLMHQVWVLSNLVPFYNELSNSDTPVVHLNHAKILKRTAQHTEDLKSGMDILSKNFDALTEHGLRFVQSVLPDNC